MQKKKLSAESKIYEFEDFTLLLDKYSKMIYSIISSLPLNASDYRVSKEDLYQEGCLGLLEAQKSFDESRDSCFTTFAYTVIKRRINRSYRRYMNLLKDELSYSKFEDLDRLSMYSTCYVEDNPIEYYALQDKKKAVKNISDDLSAEEKQVLELRLKSYSYKEIASMLNVSVKRVDNCFVRAKRKMRTRLNDLGFNGVDKL